MQFFFSNLILNFSSVYIVHFSLTVKELMSVWDIFFWDTYVKECFHSLTSWLNSALEILWKTDSWILVYRMLLRSSPPLKSGFEKFRQLPPFGGGRNFKIFYHNSVLNYLTMTKLHKKWLHIKIKWNAFGVFGLFIFKGW